MTSGIGAGVRRGSEMEISKAGDNEVQRFFQCRIRALPRYYFLTYICVRLNIFVSCVFGGE